MSSDTPIACSLSADELPKRLAEMRGIGMDALLSVDANGVMHFRADHETRQRLEAVIAAESSCCAFLSFNLRDEREELLLSIAAPEGAEPLARDLVDAFAGAAEAR
jgi:hypothetical protein